MNGDPPPSPVEAGDWADLPLSKLLAAGSIALLVNFAAALVTGLLPLQLLQTRWQLALVALAVNNGGYLLLAFVLWHLAAYFDPASPRIAWWRHRLRNWAVLVVILYLLAIPLQIYGTWTSYRQAQESQEERLALLNQRISGVRLLIEKATSPAQLQDLFIRLNAPRLSQQDLQRPLPDLKRQLEGVLARAENVAQTQLAPVRPEQIWSVVMESLRLIFTALALAAAFASGAQLSPHVTLLDSLLDRVGRSREVRRARSRQRRLSREKEGRHRTFRRIREVVDRSERDQEEREKQESLQEQERLRHLRRTQEQARSGGRPAGPLGWLPGQGSRPEHPDQEFWKSLSPEEDPADPAAPGDQDEPPSPR